VRVAPACKSSLSDEFERLIYGPCEPLFSDAGGEDCSMDDDTVDVSRDCAAVSTTSKGVTRPSHQ